MSARTREIGDGPVRAADPQPMDGPIVSGRSIGGRSRQVQVLTQRADVDRLVPAWRALAERTGLDATAFPSWTLGCFDSDPRFLRSRFRIVTVRDGNDLVGVGPFAEHHRGGWRVVTFIGLWMGQTNQLIVAPGDEPTRAAIWAALRTPRTLLDLQALDEAVGLASLERSGRWATRLPMRSECRLVDTRRPLAEMLATPERRSLRKAIGNAQRRLAADGHRLERRCAHDLGELAQLLPAIGAVEARAEGEWHGRGPHAELAAGRVPELLRGAAEDGRLFVEVVEGGGRPMAWVVGLVGAGRVTAFLNGHDPASRRYSPGHLAISGLYEYAHARGGWPVDLSLGDFEYKLRWTDDRYGIASVVAAPHRAGLELSLTARAVRNQVRGARARARLLGRSA